MEGLVRFRCSHTGGKLRVRIISPGYNHDANCQFPRAIRADGAEYTAPSHAVSFAVGPRGKYYYRVSARHVVVAAAAAAAILHVFHDEPSECAVCCVDEKDTVFAPCGHYDCCATCAQQISASNAPYCPICRLPIAQLVPRNMIEM